MFLLQRCGQDLGNGHKQYSSVTAHAYPFFSLLDLVLVGAASFETNLFRVSYLSCCTDPLISEFPVALAAAFASPPLFLGSTWPMSGISDASHCWKGFATKTPLTSYHRVKGDESSRNLVSPSGFEHSTLTL